MRIPPARFISSRSKCSGGIAFFLLFFLASGVYSQGFGGPKSSKVILHRKLPPVIHLASTTVSVKTISHKDQQADAAQLLTQLLQTDLLKNDKSLTVDDNSANVKILCTITNFDAPPRQTYTRDETVIDKGKPALRKRTFFKVSGTLNVDVKVADRSGKILDANNFTAKYSREFAQDDDQSSGIGVGSVVGAYHSMKHYVRPGSVDASETPLTDSELQQQLVRNVVALVTPRLVTTDEPVEVFLAKGKLDEADKLAEGGLWSRDLDTLETMKPLSNAQEDAYRFYNIGVANEALGYQAEDHAAAKKFFEDAAINYGKAIDAKQSEKNFIDAQNRIELAVTYYKKLDERGSKTSSAPSGGSGASKSSAANSSSGTRGKTSAALTNQKVIEMFKSGVDESSIISTIHDAHATRFDLSADGLIDLSKNGIKGKILDAMKARNHPASPGRGPNGGE